MTPPRRTLRLTLRRKLLLVSLSLLLIPWFGYRNVREMGAYLRHEQEQSLLNRARTAAALLRQHPELFRATANGTGAASAVHVYVRPLQGPIQLDGYGDDWAQYGHRMQYFGRAQLLYSRHAYTPASLSFTQQFGSDGRHLYALFEVHDDRLVYQGEDGRLGDHLQLSLEDPQGGFHRYALTTTAPGWAGAYPLSEDQGLAAAPDRRIRAEWQEIGGGYSLELRIPRQLVGGRLSFAVVDVDDAQTREIENVVGSSGTRERGELGSIVVPSPAAEALLRPLERPLSRTWVVDRGQRVLAMVGALHADALEAGAAQDGEPAAPWPLPLVYRLLLTPPAQDFVDDLSGVSRLHGAAIEAALGGHPSTRWRRSPDHQASILTATHPVRIGNTVVGAVAMEETSRDAVLLENRALAIVINLGALAFTVAAAGLLLFATVLSRRVRRLRDDAEAAIGPDGRVTGTVRVERGGDELADLGRGVAGMLERLSEYHRYLEGLAGKLSHELRTPIAVVRSSLENLEGEGLSEAGRAYAARAREGADRLAGLLTRMAEATRLEQTLQGEPRQAFDLAQVVGGCVEGYRLAHPGQPIRLTAPATPATVAGSPDLIAQLLDKLMANAREFTSPGRPVEVRVAAAGEEIRLEVCNEGPPLPDTDPERLFESMVSLRERRGEEPHLGLGLYVVRLIAEFHGARLGAATRSDPPGACFSVTFARAPRG